MEIDYKKNNPIKAKEIIDVFNSVGWNKSESDIVEAFRNSYYITAFHNEKLVGFARAISDGYYYTTIFDVVVMPEFQKRGIAKYLMKEIIKEFKHTYFFLTYTEGNAGFYKKLGFEDKNNAMWIDRGKA